MTQYGQAEAFSLWAAAQNGQPFNPDALERAVQNLLQMATQKTAGQRKDKPRDLSWDNLERVRLEILVEATLLVLQGGLDIIREKMREVDTDDLRLCARQHAGTE